MPYPGGRIPTTWSGANVVPWSAAATLSGVGAINGKPSAQPRESHSLFMASQATITSSPENVSETAGSRPVSLSPVLTRGAPGGDVRISFASSSASSTWEQINSSGKPVKTSGTVMNLRSGRPRTRPVIAASSSNPPETIAAAGLPRCSIFTMSSTRFDVQAPQSPVDPMKMSFSSNALSSKSSG